MKKFGNKRVLLNFLISYILVLLLPVLVLLAFFYPKSSDIIYDNAVEKANSILRQTVNHIEMQLRNIWYYPYAIHKNSHLEFDTFEEKDYFNAYKISQEMQNMFGYNSFIEKAILYNNRTETFYSFPGTYTLDDFNNREKTFYYLDWDKEEMMSKLNELENVEIRPASSIMDRSIGKKPFKGITIMMPIPGKGTYSYGVLLLIISEKNFSPYSNRANEINHNILVLDNKKSILAQSNHQLNIDGVSLMKRLSESNEPSSQIKIGNKTYMINMQRSNIYGLNFVNLTPLDDILSEITQLKRKTLLLVLLILIIEVGLIIILMRLNYNPIKKLRQSALKAISGESHLEKTEYEIVSYAFDNLQKENKELVSREMLNKNISMEYFFIQYLNKTSADNHRMIEQAHAHDIKLNNKVCCITFFTKDRNIFTLLASLERLIDLNDELNLISCYRVKGIRHEDFILILSFDREEQIKPFIYKIHSMDNGVKVGIGTVEDVGLLSHSYTHSLAALELAILNRDLHIMSYYDINIKNSKEISELFKMINIIELSITREDEKQFNKHLNKLINVIENDINRIFILNIIFTNTYNVFVKALNKFGINEEYCYVVPEKDLNINELTKKLLEKGHKVREHLLKKSTMKQIEISQVLHFIDEHYCEENISLQRLADEFNLSYSNFSRFFKQQTGEGFVEYLERIRLEKAKRLLRESNETIKDIAKQIGYFNPNSFTRLFKKAEGITPGNYRKLFAVKAK
ncbi:putative HTH-type transcriptional regulator YtdP [Bacillus sp. J14TS2]|uniref:helix-turn-helix domain-containing protein n=1 Tax=Bacillus sp. J14TS2 TaxID=2807188 RepID=UPI001B227FA9|nr:helix-turn-helix domain-containing protein [Bacillus sp. J14TS2]GIN71550.1 putative HTH-type transcriptional regulator YtdP [Bacillus sp. J14TS2]